MRFTQVAYKKFDYNCTSKAEPALSRNRHRTGTKIVLFGLEAKKQ